MGANKRTPIDVSFEVDVLCTGIDKEILVRFGEKKKIVDRLLDSGHWSFDPEGICWTVVRGMFPDGVNDIFLDHVKPHRRHDNVPYPNVIQADPFGRTRAAYLMVEYNPLVGLYPPDDVKGKKRRDAIKRIDAIRVWFSGSSRANPRRE